MEKGKVISDMNPDDYFGIFEDEQGDLYLEIYSKQSFLNTKSIRICSGSNGGSQVNREVIIKLKEIYRLLKDEKKIS